MLCHAINRTHSSSLLRRLQMKNGQASLSDRRVRSAVRRGIGILGIGFESGGALLLDDIHAGTAIARFIWQVSQEERVKTIPLMETEKVLRHKSCC